MTSRMPTPPPQPTGPQVRQQVPWSPPPITKIEETGLNIVTISDLVIKHLYYGGILTGTRLADLVKLPFVGVIDPVMEFLKREKLVEVKGQSGFGEAGAQYQISGKGTERAREVIERSTYADAAPVTLDQYVEAMKAQNRSRLTATPEVMKRALGHLVISERMYSKVGAAMNSGKSIFLWGPPGNGKTTISEAVGRIILGNDIWIPYAFDVDGQIIRVFDNVLHEVLEGAEAEANMPGRPTGVKRDPRWVRIRRPMIIVGGELTMSGLDLIYDPINKFYEAPYQVKSNGGLFLIDDFGRQQARPRDLLNRWIVPLEKGVDFLTLATGRKIEMPFNVLIVFSTNIDPSDLVDEAFLRRIRHKIEVGNPNVREFIEIFRRACDAKKVPFDQEGIKYLLKKWYEEQERSYRAVHPRDILDQLIDIARYLNRPPTLAPDLIDQACESYFVKLS
jgi:predicted ATPase with chaperone activity